jgi:hypothetical protein
MFFTRQHLEEIEDKSLAPYGMRSKDSKGRAYLDNEPDYRTAFQRDRDRIITPPPSAAWNTKPRSSSTTKAITTVHASPTPSKWRRSGAR